MGWTLYQTFGTTLAIIGVFLTLGIFIYVACAEIGTAINEPTKREKVDIYLDKYEAWIEGGIVDGERPQTPRSDVWFKKTPEQSERWSDLMDRFDEVFKERGGYTPNPILEYTPLELLYLQHKDYYATRWNSPYAR